MGKNNDTLNSSSNGFTFKKFRPKTPDVNPVIVDKTERKPGPNGFSIISRCPNSSDESEKQGTNLVNAQTSKLSDQKRIPMRIVHDSTNLAPKTKTVCPDMVPRNLFFESGNEEPSSTTDSQIKELVPTKSIDRLPSNGIQCSLVTSSDSECDSPSPPPLPERPSMVQRPSLK